jgi:hypothetical protein
MSQPSSDRSTASSTLKLNRLVEDGDGDGDGCVGDGLDGAKVKRRPMKLGCEKGLGYEGGACGDAAEVESVVALRCDCGLAAAHGVVADGARICCWRHGGGTSEVVRRRRWPRSKQAGAEGRQLKGDDLEVVCGDDSITEGASRSEQGGA